MRKIILLAVLILTISLTPRAFAYTVSGAELHAIALEALENALAESGEYRRHEIFFNQYPTDIKLPEGVIDIRAELPTAINYISLTPVRAIIFVNGRPYRTMSFTATVKVYDTVLVANHDLRIEVPVTASDFHLAEIKIDGRNEYVKNASEVNGLVPHRFVRAGSPVSLSYFQQPVAVNPNQRVTIVVKYHGIRVTATGIVMTRGRIGSIVKVKNETSEKILSAKVIDSGTVEVSM
ncbi:MAG: flagellar basal body P-ring formation protein FlgA [Selenomonadaceae bacterium]|nr:flagellar basal body P-ring formation protein FlgA [Selenomonadaceae bacterium]